MEHALLIRLMDLFVRKFSLMLEWQKNSFSRLLLVTLFLTLLIGLPSLLYPFGRDQGIHATVGAAILNGQLPYRDLFAQKGPYGFFIHTFVTWLFGETAWGIRLFDLIWQMVGYGFLFSIAQRRLKRPFPAIVVLFTAVAYHAAGFWHTAHHEGHLTPVLLFSLWCYEKAREEEFAHWGWLVASGAAVSATFWFKQSTAVYAIALLVWITIEVWPKKQYKVIGQYVAGGALLFSLMGLLLLSTGMLLPMLEIYDYTFIVYPALVPAKTNTQLWQLFFEWWNQHAFLTYPATIGVGFALFQQNLRQEWLGYLLILGASVYSVYAQGKFWHYHWMSTLPFLALFAAFCYQRLYDWLPKYKVGSVVILGTVVTLFLGQPIANLTIQNWQFAYQKLSNQERPPSTIRYWDDLSSVIPATVEEITKEEDEIFVWGHYSILYYFSTRQNPTNYPMDIPLIAGTRFQEEWQAEAFSEIQQNSPELILLATIDSNDFEKEPSIDQLEQFPALNQYLNDEYVFDFHLAEFQLFSPKSIVEERITVEFEEGIELKDVVLRREQLEDSGELLLSIHWQASQEISKNYTVFVQLADFSIPEIVAQSDSQPAWGRQPTSQWQVGESVWDTHRLTLPETFNEKPYQLIVGMYDAESGERLLNLTNAMDYYLAFPIGEVIDES